MQWPCGFKQLRIPYLPIYPFPIHTTFYSYLPLSYIIQVYISSLAEVGDRAHPNKLYEKSLHKIQMGVIPKNFLKILKNSEIILIFRKPNFLRFIINNLYLALPFPSLLLYIEYRARIIKYLIPPNFFRKINNYFELVNLKSFSYFENLYFSREK